MTSITFISDTHCMHREVKLNGGSILVHCGDITNIGELGVLQDFNDWLGEQEYDYKICIAGNHDKSFERKPELSRKILTNAIYLENSGVEVMGLKFWGSPLISTLPSWSFVETNEEKRFDHWKQIPQDLDVLVTHGPPRGIMDQVPDWQMGEYKLENCGDGMLMAHVTRAKPKVHCFGHIHEGYGRIETPHTTFMNVSVCDALYRPVNSPQIINL